MRKASSNAGIHPYLKADTNLFKDIKTYKQGIPIPKVIMPSTNTVINTEYKDSKGKDLYFKDEVSHDDKIYMIDYDGKNFKWILKRDENVLTLKDVCKSILLVKKYQYR